MLGFFIFIYLIDSGGGLYYCRFFLNIRQANQWGIFKASVTLWLTQDSSSLMEQHTVSFRYFQSKWSIRRLIAVQTISTGLTLRKIKRQKIGLAIKMCFALSVQRKYWIGRIWQICLALNPPCDLWCLTSCLGRLSCSSLLALLHPWHCWGLPCAVPLQVMVAFTSPSLLSRES